MIQCPLCNCNFQERDYSEKYISPYNNQEYKRYECPGCDVHFWYPAKIIKEFYENDVFELYESFHIGQTQLGLRHKAFLEYFPKNIKGNLLDVGCGDGTFLKWAQGLGFEVWGIDFDKKSIEKAKEKLKTENIYVLSLEEFYSFTKKENLKFDVITLFDVLEHQDKPKEFFLMIKDLLKGGGYIAGSVPNRERLFKEIDWKYSTGDHPPHHFLRFSKLALQNIFKSMGFTEIEIYKTKFLFEYFPTYLEKKYFLYPLKLHIKRKLMRKEKLTYDISLEDLTLIINPTTMTFLRVLKKIKNIFLLSFSIFYLPKLKDGQHLYFQTKKDFY